MTMKLVSSQQVHQEAMEILFTHLSPSKMARLLASWQRDDSDYVKMKDKLFTEETVDRVYRQAKELEKQGTV